MRRMGEKTLPKKRFKSNPPGGKKKAIPRKTMLYRVIEDMKTINIPEHV